MSVEIRITTLTGLRCQITVSPETTGVEARKLFLEQHKPQSSALTLWVPQQQFNKASDFRLASAKHGEWADEITFKAFSENSTVNDLVTIVNFPRAAETMAAEPEDKASLRFGM